MSENLPASIAAENNEFDGWTLAQLGGTTRAEIRQAQRLPEDYKAASAAELTFDPRLAYELALGIDDAHTIFPRYGYTLAQAKVLVAKPVFIATVREYKRQVDENGLTFKVKARMQAEDLLTHSYEMATDTDTPAAVRADLIKWTARMAELDPKDAEGKQSAGNFTLKIVLGDAVQTVSGPVVRTVEGEVLDKGD